MDKHKEYRQFSALMTAAWVQALAERHGQEGYSDKGAIDEACRLGAMTAYGLIAYLDGEKAGKR